MSRRCESFERLVPIILQLPIDTWFSTTREDRIEMQVGTQEEMRGIRQSFPGTFWKKSFDEKNKWWEYKTIVNGVTLHVYAVHESPKTCKAITETRQVKERVAVKYEDRLVTKEVIIGWDCGDHIIGKGEEQDVTDDDDRSEAARADQA